VFHQLIGYDRTSGGVAVEYQIPPQVLDYAKAVAGVGSDDPEAVLCYRLNSHQARDIAGAIGAKIDSLAFNFYMEGCAEPLRASA